MKLYVLHSILMGRLSLQEHILTHHTRKHLVSYLVSIFRCFYRSCLYLSLSFMINKLMKLYFSIFVRRKDGNFWPKEIGMPICHGNLGNDRKVYIFSSMFPFYSSSTPLLSCDSYNRNHYHFVEGGGFPQFLFFWHPPPVTPTVRCTLWHYFFILFDEESEG